MQRPKSNAAPLVGGAGGLPFATTLLPRLGALILLTAIIGGIAAGPSWAAAQIASVAQTFALPRPISALAAAAKAAPAVVAAAAPEPAAGVDVDGDGRADFMNPTGHAERVHDAYGWGRFGTSRDGGERRHEGVDYVSRIGQDVVAPMSGFVTRVGWAYSDDQLLRSIEITNPALHYVARVLYVSPAVAEGQAVALGQVIGTAQSLQSKYPGGMTNHVHLQIARQGRAWMDCERLIPVARG